EYEPALTVLEEGMAIAQALYAPDAPEIADYHNAVGYAHRYIGRDYKDADDLPRAALHFDKARRHYQRALRLSRKAYSPGHDKIAMCLNNLGTLYEAQGDFDSALRFLE